jgi:hypothetical protein
MSKKNKKAAKLAAQRSRKEMLARRTDDAAASFLDGFPSPYATPEEEEADRQLCAELRGKAIADAKDDEPAGELFVALDDETFAFRPWAIALRDQLAERHGSVDDGEERARFHLARFWLSENRNAINPQLSFVAGRLIQKMPFDLSPGDEGDDAPAAEEEREG